MKKIGLFFGPINGAVHRVTKLVADKIGAGQVDVIHIAEASADDLANYDTIIFGISTIGRDTWDQKFSNVDWARFFPVVSEFDFTGKKVAVFGLGDQVTYAYHFVDSMGQLAKKVIANGATLIGKVSPEGYSFQDSEALLGGEFLGLPVDEDFEPEQTEGRVAAWINQLMNEF